MQDLDDDPRVGRRRLSAIQGERGAPTVATQDASVVSAQRLLKVATALSDGATKLHEQLRHLEAAERDAILDLVAEQVTEIVSLWADLVRTVVSTDDVSTSGADEAGDEGAAVGPRRAAALTETRPGRGAGDHPARVPAARSIPEARSPGSEAHRGSPAVRKSPRAQSVHRAYPQSPPAPQRRSPHRAP